MSDSDYQCNECGACGWAAKACAPGSHAEGCSKYRSAKVSNVPLDHKEALTPGQDSWMCETHAKEITEPHELLCDECHQYKFQSDPATWVIGSCNHENKYDASSWCFCGKSPAVFVHFIAKTDVATAPCRSNKRSE